MPGAGQIAVVAPLAMLDAATDAQPPPAATALAEAERQMRTRRLLAVRLAVQAAVLASTAEQHEPNSGQEPAGNRRRFVERADGGWCGSTIFGYLKAGDEITYKKNLRVTRATFELDLIAMALLSSGFLVDSQCRNPELAVAGRFKLAVCMYLMAHLVVPKVAGDAASLGAMTVKGYLAEFVKGVPITPRSPEYIRRMRQKFEKAGAFPLTSCG
eukprot:scaffold2609_cov123-Isochrysis_galbana.AAC.2